MDANSPKPIRLESQQQLFEVELALEERIRKVTERIDHPCTTECSTPESLKRQLAHLKAAYDIVRKAC
ncbi:MAG: hypothetical protein ACJ8LG_21570 [Massilia sp.]